jgi:hypothetical protein
LTIVHITYNSTDDTLEYLIGYTGPTNDNQLTTCMHKVDKVDN